MQEKAKQSLEADITAAGQAERSLEADVTAAGEAKTKTGRKYQNIWRKHHNHAESGPEC